ncbi:MAG TPA: calcium-binding protein [Rhizomicrobium sp.]|jgi:Ca2+-binding RTX toxin-like protein|nr:calcium-binding protein [Rhizomicrobium sp.]
MSDKHGGSVFGSAYTDTPPAILQPPVHIDGSDSFDEIFVGDSGNNTYTGTAGRDLFDMGVVPNDGGHGDNGGGVDKVSGLGGNDQIDFGHSFIAQDQVDGGAGNDVLDIGGDYFSGIVFGAKTMVNVETLTLFTGATDFFDFSYKLTMNDANVAAGKRLTIDWNTINGPADQFNTITFNGSTEKDGSFTVFDEVGNDIITGGQKNDTIEAANGGNDNLNGSGGNDFIAMGRQFRSADRVNGGSGSDELDLRGDYSGGITFGADTLRNVELLHLRGGSYVLTTNDNTVAATATLTVDGSEIDTGKTLTFHGSAETNGKFDIIGSAGSDVIVGGALADTFDLSLGGNDNVSGGGGADRFQFGASFTAADHINGNAGTDQLFLNGNYANSHEVTLGASTLTSVESIGFTPGHSYVLTENNANVAANQTLEINGSGLNAGDVQFFNGSAETDGHFFFAGGMGTDVDIGGTQSDTFQFFGTSFANTDELIGGGGNDVLKLVGDYSAKLTLTADTIQNIGAIELSGADTYNLKLNDGNIAAGKLLLVDARGISGVNHIVLNDAAETNGKIQVFGSLGADTITGGAGNDFITGYGGADHLTGGAGADRFVYTAASESTGTAYDSITDFDAAVDSFGLAGVTAVHAAITSGTLSAATFDADLAAALKGNIGKHHAVVFTPTAGTLSGHTFLIVDVNGVAGYQSGQDIVIKIDGAANLDQLSAASFHGVF